MIPIAAKSAPKGPIPVVYVAKPADAYQKEEESLARSLPLLERPLHDIPKFRRLKKGKFPLYDSQCHAKKLENEEIRCGRALYAEVLRGLPSKDHMLDKDVIIEAASIIHGNASERKASIDRVLSEMLLPYCKDDKDVLSTILEIIKDKITEPSSWRRRLSKIYRFFFGEKECKDKEKRMR